MVMRIPVLSASAFLEALIALDANDYVLEEIAPPSPLAIDSDDGSGRREMTAMAGLASLFGSRETQEQMEQNSAGIKANFLRSINRMDLDPARIVRPKYDDWCLYRR